MKQKHKAFSNNKFSHFIFTSKIGPTIGYLFHLYIYISFCWYDLFISTDGKILKGSLTF